MIDTNVLVSALRSQRGASFSLIRSIPSGAFEPCLSIGLYAEWRQVITRREHLLEGRSVDDALAFLRYLASQCHFQEIHFLWRPFLPDPGDDMVLELRSRPEAGI